MRLAALTSPQVRDLPIGGLVVVLPLGSFEQHGPHLPLTTDSDLVTAVAEGIERARPDDVLLLPTLWTGHSTHHTAFPGTLSVSQMHYIALVVDLCRSIVAMGGAKLFLLNGHGGNDVPVRAAMRELKTELGARDGLHVVFASYWSLSAASLKKLRESELGGMGHACELETSIMLHLDPTRVRMELAAAGGPAHPFGFRRGDLLQGKPVYTVSEFHELSPSGVVGRPDLASAEKGAKFLEAIVRDVLVFVDDFLVW